MSRTSGTSTDGSSLTTSDTLYIDWAVLNSGSSATTSSFSTQLFVDGVLRTSWSTSPPLSANYYTYITDYSIGKLSAGSHTLRIKTDSGGAVAESSESDNEYTRTITVSGGSANLTPYQPSGWSSRIVVSRSGGTNTDSSSLSPSDTLYIDWAVINNGASATTSSFSTQLYVDGVLRTTWSTSPPLNAGYYSYITDYSIGTLSAGSHTLRIKTDSGGSVAESSESDNEYTRTITVSGGSANLTPYQPSGWASKIVVSKTTGTNTDGTSLTTGDTLYIDWAVINSGSGATAASFSTQLFLDGVLHATWSTSPPLNGGYYSYITDYSLGKLAAGSHTLRIKTDAGGTIAESSEADNEFTRTITVGAVSGSSNVTPYQPSGWANKIVVSRSTGTNSDGTSLTTGDTLYIDWAVINNGTSPTAVSFSTQLFLDGVLKATWSTSPPLNANYYSYITDYSLGKLSPGSHTLRIKTDAGGALVESNEADNEYTRTITVGSVSGGSTNVTPYQPSGWANKIVVSRSTGTSTDGTGLTTGDTLYIDWAVINNGTSATAVSFSTQLFLDGVLKATWSTSPPLNANYYSYITDYSLGKLSAGSHTLRIKTDAGGALLESNEADNEYTRTITVGSVSGGSTNVTPYQPSGWPNKIVVSRSTGTSTDGTSLTTGDTLYIDWAVINNGTSATAVSFSTQLFLDGVLKATWSTSPPLNANYYSYITDYSLGKLSAGSHTLRIKTDAGGALVESNEADNEYTRTITVGGVSGGSTNVTPYQPSGWTNKIVVSTQTGTRTDGSVLNAADSLYIDWAVINNGGSATATKFSTQLFVDEVLKATWFTPAPLNANYYTSITDYSLGKLAAGSHTLRIKTDAGGSIIESNEADNEYTRTITVGGAGSVNLSPYQVKDWPDKVVVSKVSGTAADSSGLTPSDTLYIDLAVLNNGSSTMSTKFSTQIFVDGTLKATLTATAVMNPNNYVVFRDHPLGTLSSGPHTIRVKTDAGGAITETNEGDNEYTRTIRVYDSSGPCLILVHGSREADSSSGYGTSWLSHDKWVEGRDYWRTKYYYREIITSSPPTLLTDPNEDFIQVATGDFARPFYVVRWNGAAPYWSTEAAGAVAQQIVAATNGSRDPGGNFCRNATEYWVASHSMGGTVMDYLLGNTRSSDPYPNKVYSVNAGATKGTAASAPFATVASRLTGTIAIGGAHKGSLMADLTCNSATGALVCEAVAGDNCTDARAWLKSGTSTLVEMHASYPATPVWLIGGYKGGPTSGCLPGQDDAVLQYATQFACIGLPGDYWDNNPICGTTDKQEIDNFFNIDAAHENHDDEKNARATGDRDRLAILDGVRTENASNVSTAAYISELLSASTLSARTVPTSASWDLSASVRRIPSGMRDPLKKQGNSLSLWDQNRGFVRGTSFVANERGVRMAIGPRPGEERSDEPLVVWLDYYRDGDLIATADLMRHCVDEAGIPSLCGVVPVEALEVGSLLNVHVRTMTPQGEVSGWTTVDMRPMGFATGRIVETQQDTHLSYEIEVHAAHGGRVYAEATLYSAQNQPVAWAQAAAEVAEGNGRLTLSFDNAVLSPEGAPYRLRYVRLSDTSTIPSRLGSVVEVDRTVVERRNRR